MRSSFVWMAVMSLLGVAGAAPATRVAIVEDGILRWQDDHSEVALFGVNYYVPFSIDYMALKERGLDHERAIREDVTHFARLGLTALRLHCWDREMSDHEGNLKQNEHLRLLDFLIAECKRRGIYTVLTPIAWWGSSEKGGFSELYTMHQMTTDTKARAAQCNYLKQFMSHINYYTGMAYKDDPAIVAIELINEPLYPPGTKDEQITEYVNALAGAVRSTKCRKPIFYNRWQGRHSAVAASSVDGVTFGWYPTGLVNGAMLRSNYLHLVEDYPSMRDPLLARKAKIVYEFDAADVHMSYMYPAMARAFRLGGAQIATQFQYDPLCIGGLNANWQTHYLNLVYTPAKAISFAIAAELFRRTPRLQAPIGFRMCYENDLSEMALDDAFMYSNDTNTSPPAPEKLMRIAGCGSSPIVKYEGAGAYFLDRVAPGVWKLHVYPDAVMVADPYMGGVNEKVRVLWATWRMQVRLPELGEDFRVAKCDNLRRPRETTVARDGSFEVTPGEYLLVGKKKSVFPEHATGVEWIAPPSSQAEPTAFFDAPASWREGKPCQVNVTIAAQGWSECTLQFQPGGAAGFIPIPMNRKKPYQYSAQISGEMMRPGTARMFISAQRGGGVLILPKGAEVVFKNSNIKPVQLVRWLADQPTPQVRSSGVKNESVRARFVPGRDQRETALRMEADGFGPPPSCSGVDVPVTSTPRDPALYNTLTVVARGGPDTTAVEVSLVQKDGNAFGTNIPLWPTWGEVSVPLNQLRPMWRTQTKAPDLSQLDHVAIIFGAGLFEEARERRHAVEIQNVELTRKPVLWTMSVVAKDSPMTLIEPAKRKVRTHGHPASIVIVRGMDPGKHAVRVSVKNFNAPPDSTSFRLTISPETACWRDEMRKGKFIIVKARAGQPATNRVEIVFIEADGSPWGTTVKLKDNWESISIPISELKYFSYWRRGTKSQRGGVGDKLRPENIEAVNVCFGAWLYGEDRIKPHAIEIQEVALSHDAS